jgi:predicted enzyme related to lactoylglutathione lyase
MPNPVMQFQILSKNPDNSAAFYSKLFGWSINADNALGYRTIKTGSENGIEGGIWPSPPEGHAFVQLFVHVTDMKKIVEQAKQLGGKVIVPPQKLPDGDELAILHDAEGIPFGVYRGK